MPVSALQKVKRVFVKVLLSTAVAYQVTLTVNRESADEALLAAYRQVVKKAHPDKGALSELLLRKNTYAKTCDLLVGAYEASAARDRHRQKLVGGVFW